MLRILLGLLLTVKTDICLAELGIWPLHHYWLERMVRSWNFLLDLQEDKFTRALIGTCVTLRSPLIPRLGKAP